MFYPSHFIILLAQVVDMEDILVELVMLLCNNKIKKSSDKNIEKKQEKKNTKANKSTLCTLWGFIFSDVYLPV